MRPFTFGLITCLAVTSASGDDKSEAERKLREAAKVREEALDSSGSVLLQHLERALKQDLAKLTTEEEVRLYFGNRVARGNFYLWKVKQVAGKPNALFDITWVAKDKRAQVAELQSLFFQNTRQLIDELTSYRKRTKAPSWSPSFTLDPDDRRRGQELGIDNIEQWTFFDPPRGARALADFALNGKAPFWTDVSFTIRPSLAEADPPYATKAFALLEGARREYLRTLQGQDLERAMAETTETYAEGLITLGRPAEAVAQWQAFLDAYPKAREYEPLELKAKDVLGISTQAEKFEVDLKSCTRDTSNGIYDAVTRAGRAGGSKRVLSLVERISLACSPNPQAKALSMEAYLYAAQNAVMRGDCGLYRALRGKALELGKTYSDPVLKVGSYCE
jgi:hypothetical protein